MNVLTEAFLPVHFSFSQHRYTLTPQRPLKLFPHEVGNLLRGTFGKVFKRICCSFPSRLLTPRNRSHTSQETSCDKPDPCPLLQTCPYSLIFNPVQTEVKRLKDPPRPFVLKPPLHIHKARSSLNVSAVETAQNPANPYSLLFDQSHPLQFDFVLAGKAQDYFPYFIVTVKEMASQGLGRSRIPCTLEKVEAIYRNELHELYSKQDGTVRNLQTTVTADQIIEAASLLHPESITLRFLTPTILRSEERQVASPSFTDLLLRLRDRVSALCRFYAEKPWETDFKGIAEMAERVQTKNPRLTWREQSRYSRAREIRQPLSGFIGEVTYERELEPFLPLLLLGTYLHVGKSTVFGNGWYEVIRFAV